MNSLPPDLQRLMHWARQAAPPEPPPIPNGFAARVVARRQASSTVDHLLGLWQRAVWHWAWAALAVSLVGAALLATQFRSSPPFDLNAAYQLVSVQFVP
jgi:hypothetical protein